MNVIWPVGSSTVHVIFIVAIDNFWIQASPEILYLSAQRVSCLPAKHCWIHS